MTINRADAERWMRRCRELAAQARAQGDAPANIAAHAERWLADLAP